MPKDTSSPFQASTEAPAPSAIEPNVDNKPAPLDTKPNDNRINTKSVNDQILEQLDNIRSILLEMRARDALSHAAERRERVRFWQGRKLPLPEACEYESGIAAARRVTGATGGSWSRGARAPYALFAIHASFDNGRRRRSKRA